MDKDPIYIEKLEVLPGQEFPKGIENVLKKHAAEVAVILGMGIVTGAMNAHHGVLAFTTAGLKQCAYSTVSASVLLSFQAFLSKRVTTLLGEISPMFLPALVTIIANFGLHSLKGTEEPILSTIPTATMAVIGFPILQFKRRVLELWEDFEELELTGL